MASQASTQHCPFMRLPSEIRLMIYDRIPIELKVREITHQAQNDTEGESFRFSLIDRTISTAILSTCRQVCQEAGSIIGTKCALLLCYPLRMLFDTANAHFQAGGPLRYVSAYLLIADWEIESERAARDGTPAPPRPALDPDLVTGDSNFPNLLPIAIRWVASIHHQKQHGLGIRIGEFAPPAIEIGLSAAPDHSENTGIIVQKILQSQDMEDHPHLPYMLYQLRLVVDTFQSVHKDDIDTMKQHDFMVFSQDPNTEVCFEFAEDVDNAAFADAWTAQRYCFAASR